MNAPLASHLTQAKALADYLREQGFLDDEDLIADTIEGETDAMEAVSRLLRWLAERGANARRGAEVPGGRIRHATQAVRRSRAIRPQGYRPLHG
jgi:hypothetical protein